MNIKLPTPKFVGFFPKLPCPSPRGFGNSTIKEVCSVSNCIADGPDDWIEKWLHNEFCFYDSEEKVDAVLGNKKSSFHYYAYKLYPIQFTEGKANRYPLSISLDCSLSDYNLLGYDAVSRYGRSNFGCSPLSCNGMYAEYQVNQYCLIDILENAYNCCLKVESEGAEPGPYFLFEVYRKRRD